MTQPSIPWEEFRAIEKYFLETGGNFVTLSSTERINRVLVEYERRETDNVGEIEGNLSCLPGDYGLRGSFDIT